jgi:hypothetical protein
LSAQSELLLEPVARDAVGWQKERPTLPDIDFWNLLARKRFALPDDWQWFQLKAINDHRSSRHGYRRRAKAAE